ncbi:LADA_0B02652g1_1 [Lachancea dasiensis]|uniref:LADA_0B02652g1_1 n=1 Tax=Lachancea dasiensis TaxID=1072105 RepID=A0A1G4ISB1_9SACH|nr:LADA_0B02652g1_1 [Lachancea dasiensis]
MFQHIESTSFSGNGLKRDSQWCADHQTAAKMTTQQPKCKRLKRNSSIEPSISKYPSSRDSSPLVEERLGAIAMGVRQDSCDSTESSPYVEIEDYILKGYGSTLINGGYNSRLSLDNITPVNYCLYDMDAEEFDECDFGAGAGDGNTLVETPESQDVEMA